MKEELNDTPIILNRTETIKNSIWIELHHKIVQDIIDFFNENGENEPNYNAIVFHIDNIKESVSNKKWHPSTDSSLELYDNSNQALLVSM